VTFLDQQSPLLKQIRRNGDGLGPFQAQRRALREHASQWGLDRLVPTVEAWRKNYRECRRVLPDRFGEARDVLAIRPRVFALSSAESK
jgi:hypothetical protein